MNFFYGGSPASDIYTLRSAKLAIFFGANHVETRMGGGGVGYAYQKALEESGCKIIHIDPKYNDSMIGHCDEWIPYSTRNRCSFNCCTSLCDDKRRFT
ncbi:hypothetical protein ACI2EL_06190 [Campylobacter jejuni]|uniref:hypothetical protein n=1 Tax=Campylobacter jejuni TaxID=197 RepID=UPI0038F8851C